MTDPIAPKAARFASTAAIAMGCALTLAIYGYQFGHSNHTVYLIDALRQNDPTLLANDWFTTHTLQYHAIFTQVTALLMRLDMAAPAFAIGYGLLILLFHIGFRGIVRALGGSEAQYLLAVVLYYLFAAGTGLGMYQFFQDSALLPSNIANVAMLWATWMWLANSRIPAGAAVGIAGVFHLNHALIGVMGWMLLTVYEWPKPARRGLIIGSLLAILPSAVNIGLAASQKLSRSGAMPLGQFIEIYVRLRHPHHYDPSTWPVGIWLAVLLPAIAGLAWLRGRSRGVFLFMLGLNLLALMGAGMWYVSETLVQMSLYRFSIYVQYLGCVAGAIWLGNAIHRPRVIDATAYVGAAVLLGIAVVRGPFFGVFRIQGDDSRYREVCSWVARNTPSDAVLVVPPDEESMRLIGRRAIVVNFKGVPQLSAELAEWDQRLRDVLAIDSLRSLPRGFEQTTRAMRHCYSDLPAASLESVATKYSARYFVALQLLETTRARLVYTHPSRRYFVYEVGD